MGGKAKELAIAIQKLSLAKNIIVAEGMLKVWEECLLEDESDEIFYFSDFIEGIRAMIRKPIYNRIDYADVYKEAKEISYRRRLKEMIDCPFCKKRFLSLEDVLRNIYKQCSCGKNTEEILSGLLNEKRYMAIWDYRIDLHEDMQ